MHLLSLLFDVLSLLSNAVLGRGENESAEVTQAPPTLIHKYEYGAHVPGEKKSLKYFGKIPASDIVHTVNITPTVEGLEKRFTYVRVEYVNAVSKVMVNFDHKTNIITFTVVFPFVETKYGVIGYSMPLPVLRELNETEIVVAKTEKLYIKNE